jgi:dihydroorotate dehydrogenase
MGVFSVLKSAARSSTRAADDIADAAGDTIRTGVRKGTSPLSIAAVGGAGAYSYGKYTDFEQSENQTERYTQYQERLAEIEEMYANGEISRAQMKDMKEQARQDYYASGDDDASNRGLSFTEFLAQLGTLQLVALAATMSAGLYFVARPLAQAAAENDISLESVLG